MKRTSAGAGLLAVMVLAICGVAWAQSAATTACTWENARTVSLLALEASGERLVGQCVRVRGQLTARDMSVERRRGATTTVETTIGAYFVDRSVQVALADRPRYVQALGVVGHCRNVCADSDPDAICMPIGHCHYYDDPYVMIQDVR
jgi:hypothetical protein